MAASSSWRPASGPRAGGEVCDMAPMATARSVAGQQDLDIAPEDIRAPVAEHLLGRRLNSRIRELCVHREDRVVGGFENGALLGFAFDARAVDLYVR